jgi:hypothetical protein
MKVLPFGMGAVAKRCGRGWCLDHRLTGSHRPLVSINRLLVDESRQLPRALCSSAMSSPVREAYM